ncbi:MAG TPA: energy transducer TonB [Acidobacteriaceae bacterium]
MRLLRPAWLAFLFAGIAVMGTACPAQSPAGQPAQVAPPQNLPSPVTPPKVLSGDDRVPPQCAGLASAEVKVEFVVTTDGDAREIHVLESPSAKQGVCAVETVRGYKFLPAMQDGNPVQIKLVLTIDLKVKA